MLVDNGVTNQVHRFECVKVLQLRMQLCDFVILSVDFPKGLELLDAAQISKPVA